MMDEPIRIALIGFGEVGQILADDLLARSEVALTAWDPKFADPSSFPALALRQRDVRAATDAADAVDGAALVISAVTADQTLAAAHSIITGLTRGCFFFDLNSASPRTKQAAAAIIDQAGGRYVEAALMSPIGPKRIASPFLLGGPHAGDFQTLGQRLGFDGARFFSEIIGKASAAKMCRSVMVKGIEALLTESMLAARHYGVEDTVLASLDDLLPGPDWQRLAHYMISRSIEHGTRRADEMREVARTVSEAGFAPMMSSACAARQDWASRYKVVLSHDDLHDMLDAITASWDLARKED